MIELFQMGGILFMSILTIELLVVLFLLGKGLVNKDSKARSLIKSVGLLAVITGILGQLIGFFSAFEAIQQMGSVSPALLAGGLKVSMITTMYGITIYIIAILSAVVLKIKA
ncbi:MotA/TolQ/ExbB proton channel family protein [Ekhidna lutea]|uniref:MotA/TolQ/ExbB proton channel family protein n=1 Tax=Ekhidna lutea TaxID=447679 RepID=A0A239K799_EKHLU|nr:MotA/TolQ/ExbB proton channel family protein [Ekhidna lutea]SNT13628.1 MotA/TolQ/ExbB proton channel family protein [Ekhidna lutea]